jgi:hypothetical protein
MVVQEFRELRTAFRSQQFSPVFPVNISLHRTFNRQTAWVTITLALGIQGSYFKTKPLGCVILDSQIQFTLIKLVSLKYSLLGVFKSS